MANYSVWTDASVPDTKAKLMIWMRLEDEEAWTHKGGWFGAATLVARAILPKTEKTRA